MIEQDLGSKKLVDIRVVGVGGGGNNAIKCIAVDNHELIEFISINTDHQALQGCEHSKALQIGTDGRGAGGRPEIGRLAAEESESAIQNALQGANMVFVTAGMGGGTGTGAAPVIAHIAKSQGALTVGVVTKPFEFEGSKRMRYAVDGIEELRKNVDTLVVIPNENLFAVIDPDASVTESFEVVNHVLRQAVMGIADVIIRPGLINLDFTDVCTIMRDKGIAHMGTGRASGKNKIETAMNEAINSPLLETSINGAKSILISFSGDSTLSLPNISKSIKDIQKILDRNVEIIFGTTINDDLKDEVVITVIATELEKEPVRVIKAESKDEPFFQEEDAVIPNKIGLKPLTPIRESNSDGSSNVIPDFLLKRHK